jgi:hypothetical protein
VRSNKDLASFVFDDYVSQGAVASVPQLSKAILSLLSTISSVHIVLDGLDEYDQKDHKTVLQELLQFVSSNATRGICKLLVSSRDVGHISRPLRTRKSLSLSDEKDVIHASIQSFVHSRILEIQEHLEEIIKDEDLIKDIEEKLVSKANGNRKSIAEYRLELKCYQGMYLWVRLVLSTLEDVYSIREIQKAIETLPEELHEV